MEYKYYPNRPEKLTREFVEQEFSKLIARIAVAEKAETPSEWLALYADWNAFGAYFSGEISHVHYAHAQDMADAARTEADKYLREEVTPEFEKGNAVMLDAFLKAAIKKRSENAMAPISSMRS